MINGAEISTALTRFFTEYWNDEVQEFALQYPDKTTIGVDYWALIGSNRGLEEALEENPQLVFSMVQPAIEQVELFCDKRLNKVTMKLLNYPVKTRIRELRHSHILKFIQIEGIIRRASDVKPRYSEIAFQCLRCEHITFIAQPHKKIAEPFECDSDVCGKKGPFNILDDQSTFKNFQILEVQESPDSLRGAQPKNITIYVYDDLADTAMTGDKVLISGILRTSQQTTKEGKDTVLDTILEANNIIKLDKSYDELVISDEDKAEIYELSQRTDIKDMFIDSIAPSIYGMRDIKESLALQLFSGVPKILHDDVRIRGDFHILFIGDPGTAKSQLIQSVINLSPRGVFNSGKSASAVGLTATVTKDQLNDERWTLEGGALVMADGGLCAVDEMDKMRQEDHSALHEALEQQKITVSKAGIHASLSTRCAMVGAANPVNGRFNKNDTDIGKQINMTPTLLSRFDLIFIIQDKPNRENDMRIADHIGLNHTGGSTAIHERPIDSELLRKYVAYARANISPKISPEANARIKEFYVNIRNIQSNSEAIPITARSIDGLYRIAEASAKLRLSEKVTVEDAEDAIRLVYTCLRQVCFDEFTNSFNVDIIEGHGSNSQRVRLINIMEFARKVSSFTLDDLHNEFKDLGTNARTYVSILKQKSEIMEKSEGVYCII